MTVATARRLRRTRDELEFLPAALEVLETPPRPAARLSALLICLFLVIALAWSVIGEIDTVSTAHGQLVTTDRAKLIQPFEPGIIRAIHVQDGSKVSEGDVLIEIDPTESQANLETLRYDLLKSRLEAAAALAALSDDPAGSFKVPEGAEPDLADATRLQMLGEVERHKAAIAAIEADVRELEANVAGLFAAQNKAVQTLPIIEEKLQTQEGLLLQGLTQKSIVLDLRQQQITLRSDILVTETQHRQTMARIASRRRKKDEAIAAFRAETLNRSTEALRKIAGLEQQVLKEEKRSRDRQLKSPISGTVFGLSVFTIGGVVTTKDVLLRIVPSGSRLLAEVVVQNKDIGFIEKGQPAEIKLETFPFTRYGLIEGEVSEVSRDAIADEKQGLVYKAEVDLKSERILVGDKWVPLTPGMAAQVEIKTGRRPVIDYFLSPFLRYRDEALRER